MEFNGTFKLEDTSAEEVWLALSDPVLIRDSLPGCEFLIEVDDEDVAFDELREESTEAEPTGDPEVIAERAFQEGKRYAALVEIGVGSVNPSFETTVTIDEREFPDMTASGEGSASGSSFEMESGMHLNETDDGVSIEWWANAEVFGRVAQMGQRVMNPVANRVVKKFFERIQERLSELTLDDQGGDGAQGKERAGADEADDTSGLSQRIRDRIGL